MIKTDIGYQIGKKLPELRDNLKVPGVGSYEPEKIKVLKIQPVFKFPKETRGYSPENKLKNHLGPGQYDSNLKHVKESTQIYTIGKDKKLNYFTVQNVPGC